MSRLHPSTLWRLAGATMILWVVPSIGTQGMGTIGQRIVHSDAAIYDTDPAARTVSSRALTQADSATEAAAGF